MATIFLNISDVLLKQDDDGFFCIKHPMAFESLRECKKQGVELIAW
jgi:hypothetical protein